MKKSLLIFASIALIILSSSCNKTYTCVCEDSFGNEEEHLVNGTGKREAARNCDEHDIQGNCNLKL